MVRRRCPRLSPANFPEPDAQRGGLALGVGFTCVLLGRPSARSARLGMGDGELERGAPGPALCARSAIRPDRSPGPQMRARAARPSRPQPVRVQAARALLLPDAGHARTRCRIAAGSAAERWSQLASPAIGSPAPRPGGWRWPGRSGHRREWRHLGREHVEDRERSWRSRGRPVRDGPEVGSGAGRFPRRGRDPRLGRLVVDTTRDACCNCGATPADTTRDHCATGAWTATPERRPPVVGSTPGSSDDRSDAAIETLSGPLDVSGRA